MSLTTPHSVQKLQATLHAKAKDSPTQRFHALYDKVYRKDVLAHAYAHFLKATGQVSASSAAVVQKAVQLIKTPIIWYRFS